MGRKALCPPHLCLFVLRVCADQPLCNLEPFLVWINYCLNNIGRVAVDVLTEVAITQVRKIYLMLGVLQPESLESRHSHYSDSHISTLVFIYLSTWTFPPYLEVSSQPLACLPFLRSHVHNPLIHVLIYADNLPSLFATSALESQATVPKLWFRNKFYGLGCNP